MADPHPHEPRNVDLSVVVPLFDEARNVPRLVEELERVLAQIDESAELILVDDGSIDGTWQAILDASSGNPRVRGLRLSRNFGHQHALLAGLYAATGQAVISLDGDLQHPPELLPELIRRWREGYAVVNTRREGKADAGLLKRKSSEYFYKIFSQLTGVQLADGSSDFRLIDRKVLDHLLALGDTQLFLRGAVEWLGFPSFTVPFEVQERFAGTSKYRLREMLAFATGAVVSFSTKPLRVGIWLGLLTSLLAFLELSYIVVQYFAGNTVPGWASTVGVISLLFGVLFVILGLIGLYLASIHQALQQRPRFIVSETTREQNARRRA